MHLLGDVLFLRNYDHAHRRLKGLLSALRRYGRQTFISEPVFHHPLREPLDVNVSGNLNDIPLAAAVRRLAKSTELDIRIGSAALR